jgi:hypothetical protein
MDKVPGILGNLTGTENPEIRDHQDPKGMGNRPIGLTPARSLLVVTCRSPLRTSFVPFRTREILLLPRSRTRRAANAAEDVAKEVRIKSLTSLLTTIEADSEHALITFVGHR